MNEHDKWPELDGLKEPYFKPFDHHSVARPFPIPKHWPKIHAIDYGDPAILVSMAYDPEKKIYYVYDSAKKFSLLRKIWAWIRRIFR